MPVNEVDVGLKQRMDALRAEHGDRVGIDEVAEVASSIRSTMQGDFTALDLRVYKELDDLAKYIQNAKSEIANLCSGEMRNEHLPAATVQLDAIVEATEEATGNILDAAEAIEAEANLRELPTINDQVTRIFEACSFQDLTGQRIAKVVSTLSYIESQIDRLVSALGDDLKRVQPAPAQRDASAKNDGGILLSGPQLPGEGNKQEEIDALLASFD